MVLDSSPVAVTSPSDFAPASSKEFLDIQATIECRFTLKRVRDMTRTYSHTNTVIIIYIIIIIIGIIIITGNYTQNSHKMINSETIGLKYPIKLFPRNERNLTLRINFTYFDMYSSVKAAAALEFRTQVVNATSHIIRRKTI